MKHLKAYARQVVSYLPASQRDELCAELYDSLCEEYADYREDEPTLDEISFLNRYRKHPLKIALSLVVVFHVVIGLVRAFASGDLFASFVGAMASIPGSLLWVGAAVLGVFVALEKSGEKASWLDTWNAGELQLADSNHSVSRAEALFELALSSFALLWVLDIVHLPDMLRHDGEWIREWTVNLPEWFWWVAGLLLVGDILFALYRLPRTLWTRPMRGITILMQVLWIGLLLFAALLPV